jgi:hypothetical protein
VHHYVHDINYRQVERNSKGGLIPFDTIGGFNKTAKNSFKKIEKMQNT